MTESKRFEYSSNTGNYVPYTSDIHTGCSNVYRVSSRDLDTGRYDYDYDCDYDCDHADDS